MSQMRTEEMAVTPAGYQAFRIGGIDDLIYFLRNSRSTFAFRGQIDATWHIETRLRRRISPSKGRGSGIRAFERKIVEYFQSRASHFVAQPNLPADENDLLEWVALMQHYGGPSRLLDATRSIFIAAYFAVQTHNDCENAAIWAMNLSALEINWLVYRDTFADLMGKRIPPGSTYRELLATGDPRFIYPNPEDPFVLRAMVYGGFSQPGVCPMEPRRKNLRLIQQQALFFVPVDVGISFHMNLACMFTPTPTMPMVGEDARDEINRVGQLRECERLHECAVVKLIIPKSAYSDIRRDLRQMNIGVDTLFPDLEGLARSLDQFIPTNEEREEWMPKA